MHQRVQRQSKTQRGALHCRNRAICNVWKKSVWIFLELTFSSYHSSHFSLLLLVVHFLPSPLSLSSSGPAAVLLKVNFFMLEFPPREFDPRLLVLCRFLRFVLTALHFDPFVFSVENFLMLLIWLFWNNVSRHCRVWIYYVQWSERGGGCWLEKVLGGGKKGRELILQGSLNGRLPRRKSFNPICSSA